MKKRMTALLCLLALLASCGGRAQEESPAPEHTAAIPSASASAEQETPKPTLPAETAQPETEEPGEESPVPTSSGWGEPLVFPWGEDIPTPEVRRILVFQAVMERFLTEGLFPDGAPVDFSAEDRSQNQFTVWDVDRDDREELVVLLTTTQTQAGHTALIYEYDGAHGVNVMLQTYPRLTFYSGGTVQAGWPADLSSGGGVMWPYTLYEHDYQTGEYREAGSAKARTRALEGVKFPEEADLDGDGIVYCIDMDYEHPIDGAEYEAWREGILGWEREVEVPFYSWTEENIAAIGDLVMDEARAKTLIERANAALAPFLGEGAVECGQEGWLLLEGYSAAAELYDGLREIFGGWSIENFIDRYGLRLLKEEEGKVYVRSNSRDILGHYYDMDLSTLAPSHTPYVDGSDEEWFWYTAEGEGNDSEVQWIFGIEKAGLTWRVSEYACEGKTVERGDMALDLAGTAYGLESNGSPVWLGEPELREIEEGSQGRYPPHRREVYCDGGLEVDIWDYGYDGRREQPVHLVVTKPGIPTIRGVEVGDTLKEVLKAYPQFDFGGFGGGPGSISCPLFWNYGDDMSFTFDENLILTKIEIMYNISN